jgi:hypothetical protein
MGAIEVVGECIQGQRPPQQLVHAVIQFLADIHIRHQEVPQQLAHLFRAAVAPPEERAGIYGYTQLQTVAGANLNPVRRTPKKQAVQPR